MVSIDINEVEYKPERVRIAEGDKLSSSFNAQIDQAFNLTSENKS